MERWKNGTGWWLAKVALATALAGSLVLACAPDDGSTADDSDLFDNSAGADTKALNGGSSEKGYTPVGFVYANNNGDGIAPIKCTGTLIRPDAVLTMAQCVTDPSGKPLMDSKFGLGSYKSGKKYEVGSIVVHPLYVPSNPVTLQQYNLAIMFLTKQAKKVSIADLPAGTTGVVP